MKGFKKKVGKILLSFTMVFAMVLTIMPTNVFAATYPTPDITVNWSEGGTFNIPANKTTTVKFLFDRSYPNVYNGSGGFEQSYFDEYNVNYAILTFKASYVNDTAYVTFFTGEGNTSIEMIAKAVGNDITHTHTPSTAWSNNESKHWHNCDWEYDTCLTFDEAAHTAGDWIVSKEATGTEAGSLHKECTVCGYVMETAEIPATGIIPEKPVITAGAGSVHQISNGKDMTVTCSGKLEDLTGIYVDGKLVDASNYTLKSGSTILTLKTSYLDTLSAGKHTLKFQYKDNVSAETDFTITAKSGESPKTSAITYNAAFGGIILAGFMIAGLYMKKRKMN